MTSDNAKISIVSIIAFAAIMIAVMFSDVPNWFRATSVVVALVAFMCSIAQVSGSNK